MTNQFARALLFSLLVSACTASPDEPLPTKVFDFAAVGLADTGPIAAPAPNASAKAQLRYALATVRPQIASCVRTHEHPAGTIDVTLRIAVGPHAPALVQDIDVATPGSAVVAVCITDALNAFTLPAMPVAEIWTVHAPLTVDAGYAGAQ